MDQVCIKKTYGSGNLILKLIQFNVVESDNFYKHIWCNTISNTHLHQLINYLKMIIKQSFNYIYIYMFWLKPLGHPQHTVSCWISAVQNILKFWKTRKRWKKGWEKERSVPLRPYAPSICSTDFTTLLDNCHLKF